MEKLNINQWAAEDRPREKMMQKGAEALSDAELLAILIGSGNTEETAVTLMQRILAAKGAYYRLYESQYAMIRVASGAPEE